MTDGRMTAAAVDRVRQASQGWTEGWTDGWTWSPPLDGRPPPPALGFRWSPEPDYPPPT